MMLSYTAGEKDEGRKIYWILRRELGMSETMIRRLKTVKGVYLNGEPVYVVEKVKPGDVISAEPLMAERKTDLIPEDGELSVLYENEGFIVVNKPCGMLVHPSGAKLTGSLLGICAGYFKRTGQDTACHVVNRLDRDTSGAVMVAKSAHMKNVMTNILHSPEAVKKYVAVLYGKITPEEGTINAPIRREQEMMMRRIVADDGHPSVTDYRIIKTSMIDGHELSVAEFVLRTGRTHQIRVHSSYMGAPVLGDPLYCTEESESFSRHVGANTQLLHAELLRFRDPFSGALIDVEAPVEREYMKDIMDSILKM